MYCNFFNKYRKFKKKKKKKSYILKKHSVFLLLIRSVAMNTKTYSKKKNQLKCEKFMV